MSRAASQMKPASSRATAVTATLACLPRAMSRRYLCVRRSCAFQASSRMAGSMCLSAPFDDGADLGRVAIRPRGFDQQRASPAIAAIA